MALIQKRASDITGTEASEDQFLSVVVRSHPAVEQAKRLDVLPAEMESLKEVGDLVVLEIKGNDLPAREMFVRLSDFQRWLSDDALKKASNLRGRPQGYRPGNGN
jgi:hypothetical protein